MLWHDIPVVENMEKTVDFAFGQSREHDYGSIGCSGAADKPALEEVLEICRVILEDVPAHPEERILNAIASGQPVRSSSTIDITDAQDDQLVSQVKRGVL